MPLELRLTLGLLVASALAYAATPVAIRVAGRLDFFDKPKGYKGHALPTPYLGGAAVTLAFLIAAAVLSTDFGRTVPLVCGMAILWLTGTVDDRRTISPGLRVVVELGVASAVWALGLGWDLGLGGALDLGLTCLWIVAVVNAFNLFDNMDGASSSMAAVAASAVAALGAVRGDPWLAATGAALAGALLGFLPHNIARPNARIFLGDGGSMPVGFAVAVLVMQGATGALAAFQSLAIGLVLVGVPALDTCLVVVSRRRKGISVLTGGRDHLTHRTRRRFKDARAVAAALGGAQALLSAMAIVAAQGGSRAVVVVVVLYLVAAGTAIAVFEAQEDRFAVEDGAAPVAAEPAQTIWRTEVSPAYVLLGIVGLGAALSPFFSAYYSDAVWVPIGLGCVTAAAAGLISSVPRLDRSGWMLVGGITGLGAWSLLSSTWAQSARSATVTGNRWLVLAAVLGIALVLLRDERRSRWLVAVLTAGTLIVAADVIVRMLGPSPGSLFLAGRLHQPLGYINAEATAFLMGLWGCIAVAERRRGWLAGLGLAGATVLSLLAVLSQSRGAGVALLGSTICALALVPGRLKRLGALLFVLAGALAVSSPVLAVYDEGRNGLVPEGTVRTAAVAIVLSALLTGAAWAIAVAGVGRLRDRAPERIAVLRRYAVRGVVAAAALAVVALGASAGRIDHAVRAQYDSFVSLGMTLPAGSETRSRVAAGGGTRYDYWRVGVEAFKAHPALGVGAGNYPATYFKERRTREDVRQPHSLEMQALSETGIVGLALLLVAIAGVVLGALRSRRLARTDSTTRAVLVAGVGGSAAWFFQTSVDWVHLLPGLTAVALCLAAVVVRARPGPPSPEGVAAPTPARRPRLSATALPRPLLVGGALALGLLMLVTGASLARQGLSDHYRDRAAKALADGDAAQALKQSEQALRLDRDYVQAYYIRAAAFARFGRAGDAEAALYEALRHEPDDFVTYALLGDLELRLGHRKNAIAMYEQARGHNPLEASLINQLGALVKTP